MIPWLVKGAAWAIRGGAAWVSRGGAATLGRGAATLGRGAATAAGRAAAIVGRGAATVGRGAATVGRGGVAASLDKAQALAYVGNQALGGLQSVIGAVTNNFTHVITVEVHGGPKANIKRIWQLAVSAAFGKYRQGMNGGGDLTTSATWDITGKAVAIQLHYTCSGILGSVITTGNQRFAGYSEFLKTGPSQELIGGDWKMWAPVVGKDGGDDAPPANGVVDVVNAILKQRLRRSAILKQRLRRSADIAVGGAAGAIANTGPITTPQKVASTGNRGLDTPADNFGPLPDDGRVILTTAKENPEIQPYRPNMDYLIALVSAALTDPCIMPVSPPTDYDAGQKQVRLGYRVYSPGNGDSFTQRVNGLTDQTDLRPVVLPADGFLNIINPITGFKFAGAGIDGYATPETISQVPGVRGTTNDPR